MVEIEELSGGRMPNTILNLPAPNMYARKEERFTKKSAIKKLGVRRILIACPWV
jgi:hypothetical protein